MTYTDIKKCGGMFNRRYRPLFNLEHTKVDPEYLKRKNIAVAVLKALKKTYPDEPEEVKQGIIALSQAYRKAYPEINDELPLN